VPARIKGGLVLVVGVVAALVLTATALAPSASAEHVEADRVWGDDRFATAVDVAWANFPLGEVDTAILANGRDFPDALAASYASGEVAGLRAPVLLSKQNSIPAVTHEGLQELGVDTVVLVGGEAALSAAVEAELMAEGYEVDRLWGPDRFHTAAEIATAFEVVGEVEGQRTALLPSGRAFPDALAAGPLAAGEGFPLLLTEREEVPQATWDALEEQAIERVLVIGGTAMVDGSVVEALQDAGYEVERLWGPARQGTATTVAEFAYFRMDWPIHQVLLADADDFPDALVAGGYGGRLQFPILLTDHPPGEITQGWLTELCPEHDVVRAIGGPAAVADGELEIMVDVANACDH
jgi:minor extracellular serine protease Vpr